MKGTLYEQNPNYEQDYEQNPKTQLWINPIICYIITQENEEDPNLTTLHIYNDDNKNKPPLFYTPIEHITNIKILKKYITIEGFIHIDETSTNKEHYIKKIWKFIPK